MAVEVSDAISQDGLEAAAQLTCDLARHQRPRPGTPARRSAPREPP